MKKLLLAFTAVATLFMVGCASTDWQQILGSPASVQSEIGLLGAAAKSHISASAQTQIHNFATKLGQAADLDLTYLFSLIPATTGSQNGDYLLNRVKEDLTFFANKYGHNNPTTLAYAHAVANGLLLNF